MSHNIRLHMPLDMPKIPCKYISMDFVFGLSRTQPGFGIVLIVIDRFFNDCAFLTLHEELQCNLLLESFFKEVHLHDLLSMIT